MKYKYEGLKLVNIYPLNLKLTHVWEKEMLLLFRYIYYNQHYAHDWSG